MRPPKSPKMVVLSAVTLVVLTLTLGMDACLLISIRKDRLSRSAMPKQSEVQTQPAARPMVVVSGVVRVTMHGSHSFTFLVRHADGTVGQLVTDVLLNGTVSAVEDVPIGQQIWIEYQCGSRVACNEDSLPESKFISIHPSSLTIHLHSTQEIFVAAE